MNYIEIIISCLTFIFISILAENPNLTSILSTIPLNTIIGIFIYNNHLPINNNEQKQLKMELFAIQLMKGIGAALIFSILFYLNIKYTNYHLIISIFISLFGWCCITYYNNI